MLEGITSIGEVEELAKKVKAEIDATLAKRNDIDAALKQLNEVYARLTGKAILPMIEEAPPKRKRLTKDEKLALAAKVTEVVTAQPDGLAPKDIRLAVPAMLDFNVRAFITEFCPTLTHTGQGVKTRYIVKVEKAEKPDKKK